MATKTTSMLSTLLRRLRRQSSPPPVTRESPRPFQAVSIYRGIVCCAPASKLSEQRFLAKHAPVLPLTGCTMPDRCECRYLKHKDRRTANGASWTSAWVAGSTRVRSADAWATAGASTYRPGVTVTVPLALA